MRLKTLTLENFRCFKNLSITFDPSLTVIVADNGKGKTSILESIACLLGAFPSCLGVKGMPGLQDYDFHDEWYFDERGSLCKKIREAYMKVSGLVDISGYENWRSSVQTIAWEASRARDVSRGTAERKTAFSYGKSFLKEFADSFLNRHNEGGDVIYPLLVLYGTERDIGRMPVVPGIYSNKEYTISEAYKVALQGQLNYRKLVDWLLSVKHNEQDEVIRRHDFSYRSIASQLIESAIKSVLPGFHNLRVEENPSKLTIDRTEDGRTNRYFVDTQLSDGFKIVLTMVLDLISRILILSDGNINISVDELLQSPGIVLIDEVDLHLHPFWQQRIIPDLRRTFPNIQFIVTTHSPQVISSVPKECLRILDNGLVRYVTKQTDGVESQLILADVFGVDSVSLENKWANKLIRYAELMSAGMGETEECKKLSEELDIHYGAHYAPLSRIRVLNRFSKRI